MTEQTYKYHRIRYAERLYIVNGFAALLYSGTGKLNVKCIRLKVSIYVYNITDEYTSTE